MRFRTSHKVVAYLVAGLGMLSLALGGILHPALLVVAAMASVASWWAEEPLVNKPSYARTWTAVLVVLAWAALVCAFTPRSALDPGAGASPGSTVMAVLLLLGAGAAGVAAALALRATPATWDTTAAQEVTAYAGGVAGVLAVTAAAFAVLLLVRQSTARPDARPVRR